MQWLAAICVRRPVLASVLVLSPVALGIFAYGSLGVDRFPRVEFPFVSVTTRLAGSAPEEVEREISDRIEQAVNTISGVEELRSTSSEGVSLVLVTFELEKDVDVAVQEVRDRIAAVTPELPFGIDPPVVSRLDPDATPILAIAVSSRGSVRELTEYADRVLRRRLESLRGVGQVVLVGGRGRRINVVLDPDRLASYELSPPEVVVALGAQNVEVPGGALEQGQRRVGVRVRGRVTDLAALSALVIATRAEGAIRLGDVATVEDGAEDSHSVGLVDGEPAVVLLVRKQSGRNTVEVAGLVKQRLAEIEQALPAGFRIRVVRDQSLYIEAALRSVTEHLILGSVLSALVVLVFLWNGRSTIIAAIAIPTSVVSTFALMKAMGFTINVITLLALTLSVGIVIDDAIVVLENIYRHIEEKRAAPFAAAVEATREIGLAVLATTLSLVVIFVPVAFMSGIVGRFMNSFGLTMAFAIGVSLFVSFTLTPTLSARLLRRPREERARRGPDGPLERGYGRLLALCLRRRWVVVVFCLLTLAMAVPVGKAMRKNFLPFDDESQFQVNVLAPEGTSLAETALLARRISRGLRARPEVDLTLVTIGEDAARTPNLANIYVHLVPVSARKTSQEGLMNLARTRILPALTASRRDLRVSVQQVNVFSGGQRRDAPLQFFLGGPDLAVLQAHARSVVRMLAAVPGATDVDSSIVEGKPELAIEIDRDRAAELGVTVSDVAQAVRTTVAGIDVSRFEDHGEQYAIHVRADPAFRIDREGLARVTVPSRTLRAVPLANLVRFREATGPAVIERLGRRRQVTVAANLQPGASLKALTDAIDAHVRSLGLDPSISTGYIGQSREQSRAAMGFAVAFALSFVFMYLVLAAQFESWIHPITILVSLPLTIPFGMLSLYLLGDSLNIFSALGMFVLFGVVKKNGILQVDRILQLRAQGKERDAAVLEASKTRLRPILMTTVAFVAGMVPLVLSSGVGSATNRTTGSVIIGGQMMSLVLTLVATPIVYTLLDDASGRVRRLGARLVRRPREAPAPAGGE